MLSNAQLSFGRTIGAALLSSALIAFVPGTVRGEEAAAKKGKRSK